MLVVAALITLAGAIATVAALLTLHLLPTGLSPVRDAVSAYGISRYAGLYRAQTLATAVGAIGAAIGLAALVGDAAIPAVISFAVLALARGLISWFPMDAPDAARTTAGRIHNLLAFAAFAAASVAGFMTSIAFGAFGSVAADGASWIAWITTAASAFTLIAAAVPSLRRAFGLVERLIYVGMLALLVLVGAVLATA